MTIYDELPQIANNFTTLSPLSYLQRAAVLYAKQDAIIYGKRHISWQETHQRCRAFASQLRKIGVDPQDTVSTLLPNVPALFEAHFAVPMVGAILNPLSPHLDAQRLATLFTQAKTKVLLVDPQFSDLAKEALSLLIEEIFVIDVDDEYYEFCFKAPIGHIEYEDWLADGDEEFVWHLPLNEYDPICLHYDEKYHEHRFHHRDTYLHAAHHLIHYHVPAQARVLWNLNLIQGSWGLAWSVAMNGGTQICLRQADADKVWQLLHQHHIHYLGADAKLLLALTHSQSQDKKPLPDAISVISSAQNLPVPIRQQLLQYGLHLIFLFDT